MKADAGSPDLARLLSIAKTQAGYFTAPQAAECGLSWSLCSYHTSRGRFIRIRRGLYRVPNEPATSLEHVFYAWLATAVEGALVSHESALELFGLTQVGPAKVHLTIERRLRRKPPPGVVLHAPKHFPHPNEVTTHRGLPVTIPGRAIVDAAASDSPTDLVATARRAIQLGVTNGTELLFLAQDRGTKVRRIIRQAVATDPHRAGAGGQP